MNGEYRGECEMRVQDSMAGVIESRLRAACLDMEQRVRGGDDGSAERMLELYPELADDADSALELIFAEFVLRRQRGEQPLTGDWYARFPQWRERLERLFEMYELMGTEGTRGTLGAPQDTVPTTSKVGLAHATPVQGDGSGTATNGRGVERRVGSYEVLEEIARGGMGVVYKARHVALHRVVALKLILAGEHAGAEHRARFRREAEAAARLAHPSIVQIFEIGEEGNLPYLAMEYVEGPRLDELLSRRRAEGSIGLAPREAAELVEALARAIQHAHEHGVVHRDLKPANVLLQIADCRLRNGDRDNESAICNLQSAIPKITDFGLAKTLNESQVETRTGLLLGTPSYMSPEQAGGRPGQIGPATDVFALGVILYELVTGCLPFQGTSVAETLEQVRTAEPVRPTQLQRGAPHDLETICLKCLQKEPAKRYRSAEELAEDIGRHLRDEPILARPVGRVERGARWCRRNPAVAALTGGIALLLVCGTVVSATLAVWALDAKNQAGRHAEQEREARALADQRFAQAEKAVEEYLDGIENNERLKEADFFELRKQLVTSAIPFYEDFVKAKPGDAALEAKRGQAYYRLGFLRQQLGEDEQAIADYGQTQAIFQKLSADFPQRPEYRHALAKSHLQSGIVLRQLGKHSEARAAQVRSLAVYQALEREFPGEPGNRQGVGRSHHNLGVVLSDLNLRAEAAEQYRKALAIQQTLADSFPKQPGYRRDLAATHNSLSLALSNLGDTAEAEAQQQQSLALSKALADEFPAVAEYQIELSRSQNNMATLLKTAKKLPEAEAVRREAIRIQTDLAAQFPKVPVYRYQLAITRFNLGNVLGMLGKKREQKEEYREALELFTRLVEEFPGVPDYEAQLGKTLGSLALVVSEIDNLNDEARQFFAKAIEHQLRALEAAPNHPDYLKGLRDHYHGLADLGRKTMDHVTEAQAARGLAEARPDSAEDPVLAARYFGRCVQHVERDKRLSEAERQSLALSYADEGMECLREAVRRGFSDANSLKNLAALAPFRGRPDYKQLVRELEEKADVAVTGVSNQ